MIHIKIIDNRIVNTERGWHDTYIFVEDDTGELEGLSENEIDDKLYDFLGQPFCFKFWHLKLDKYTDKDGKHYSGIYQTDYFYDSGD